MAWGHTGVYCLDCKAEWNYTWHTERAQGELVLCPSCNSKEIGVFSQTVPFAIGGGIPPDYLYYCICGSVFQSPPVLLDSYEQDPVKLAKQMEITCIFCQRSNQSSWYIPKK